jgi:hypothetical protein
LVFALSFSPRNQQPHISLPEATRKVCVFFAKLISDSFLLEVIIFGLYHSLFWFWSLSMDTQKSQPDQKPSSCRKKKNEEATFIEDLKDHIDEFIHASMDEHKACFQKTMNKVCVFTLSFSLLGPVCSLFLSFCKTTYTNK